MKRITANTWRTVIRVAEQIVPFVPAKYRPLVLALIPVATAIVAIVYGG